jgi:MFS family permease
MSDTQTTDQDAKAAAGKIRIFAAASFLNDMGSDIIYPVWPLFVTQVLRANMAALGFLDGLGEALVSLSQAVSGYYSDRLRRKKVFIWTGYLCGALSRLGYASSAVWQHLIPFRMLDRIGKIRSAPRDALIADLSTRENRGRHFGLLRTMDNLGAVCGITICILFIGTLGYRRLFLLAAIPSLIGSMLILGRIKEKRDRGDGKLFKGFTLKHLDRNLGLYFALNAIFALGAFSYSFLMIYARNAGYKVGAVPILYLAFTAAAALLSLPFGRLSDRIGRKPVLLISMAVWAAVCAGVVFSRSMALVPLIFIGYGVHKAALEPVQRTLVTELCPPAFRASVLGGFQMVIGLCALPASLGAGFLWIKLGASAPFLLSIALTIIAAALLFFVKEKPAPDVKP